MKKLLVFALLLISSLQSFSQNIEVEITKKNEIVKISGLKFYINEYIKKDDTFYLVMFQNQEYSSITDVKSFSLDKDELKKFVDALIELTNDKYEADEASVTVNDEVTIRKVKIGSTRYWIRANRGYTHLGKGQVERVKEAVYKYFEYADNIAKDK